VSHANARECVNALQREQEWLKGVLAARPRDAAVSRRPPDRNNAGAMSPRVGLVR